MNSNGSGSPYADNTDTGGTFLQKVEQKHGQWPHHVEDTAISSHREDTAGVAQEPPEPPQLNLGFTPEQLQAARRLQEDVQRKLAARQKYEELQKRLAIPEGQGSSGSTNHVCTRNRNKGRPTRPTQVRSAGTGINRRTINDTPRIHEQCVQKDLPFGISHEQQQHRQKLKQKQGRHYQHMQHRQKMAVEQQTDGGKWADQEEEDDEDDDEEETVDGGRLTLPPIPSNPLPMQVPPVTFMVGPKVIGIGLELVVVMGA